MNAMIYLDNNATTCPIPSVTEKMIEALTEGYGNPSSSHLSGEHAKAMVQEARGQVAQLLNARETEIIFTSGATESINTALRGAVEAAREDKPRIIITAVEHEAVIDVSEWLKAKGCEVVKLPVNEQGQFQMDAFEAALKEPTTLVSVMSSNNETGVLFPIKEIAAKAKAAGAAVHIDAVQAVGKMPLDVVDLGVDFLSLSGHKFHGPKGVGVLYVRRGARFRPLVIGAGHELGRRGGTENVPGVVGIGAAAAHMAQGIEERRRHLSTLSGLLEAELLAIPDTRLNGVKDGRLPGTVNVSFKGIEGSAIVITAARDGLCLSAGSACSAAQFGASHVLEAMKVPFPYLYGAVRFSCCSSTTEAEVHAAVKIVAKSVEYLRSLTPTA